MYNFQFTFYNPDHKYRPITVTVTPRNTKETISSLKNRAVKKACAERHWTVFDMTKKYNYTVYRCRQVNEKGEPVRKVEKAE